MITDTLIEKIKKTNNPSVVGLDPRLEYIPGFIKEKAFAEKGHTFTGAADAFYEFNRMIIDEVYELVPAVKPQIAMYEQYGADGIAAYIKTAAYAKRKGLIVIGDIKRSDIASTAEAYSDGHLGRTLIGNETFEAYGEDFVTLNAFLGSDSIEPFTKNCAKYDKGIFVLVKTSNPRSWEFQDLDCGGRPLYEHVAERVARWGERLIGGYGYSAVGAVVGATHSAQAARLRAILPGVFFLVPGYGAQGATAEELSVCFDKKGLGAIVNSSRGIIAAWKQEKYKKDFPENEFAKAAKQAAIDMRDDLLGYVKISEGPSYGLKDIN